MARLEYQRIRRKANGNADVRKYEKTVNGFLMRLHRNMRSRIGGVQKAKHHLYEGKSVLDRALRHNSGKPLTCYIDPRLLLETGAVFANGAQKYSPGNFRKSIGTEHHAEYLESVRESMMRHVYKYLSGEKADSESGLSHLAHLVANASMAFEYEVYEDE